jgi:hypothetical protein
MFESDLEHFQMGRERQKDALQMAEKRRLMNKGRSRGRTGRAARFLGELLILTGERLKGEVE